MPSRRAVLTRPTVTLLLLRPYGLLAMVVAVVAMAGVAVVAMVGVAVVLVGHLEVHLAVPLAVPAEAQAPAGAPAPAAVATTVAMGTAIARAMVPEVEEAVSAQAALNKAVLPWRTRRRPSSKLCGTTVPPMWLVRTWNNKPSPAP
jgi:hypothetical protein